MHSLTAAKEEGAFIEIDGKKVALGIPGRKPPSAADASASAKAYPDIPLARPGTADEAAAGVLLCVSLLLTYEAYNLFFDSLASPLASYVSGHTLEVTGGR